MKRFILFLGLVSLLVLSVGTVLAAPGLGRIIKSTEVINEDVTVFGDNLVIEAGAEVNGDVSIFGGNAEIAGTINGDIAIFGGNITLSGPTTGDIAVFGGNINLVEGASLTGDCATLGGAVNTTAVPTVSCSNFGNGLAFSFAPSGFNIPGIGSVWGSVGMMMALLGQTVLAGALAWVIASMWPQNIKRVTETMRARPVASGLVGMLTTGAFASLMTIVGILSGILLVVCIGVLGFPVMMIMGVAFAAATAVGWVSMGHVVGRRFRLPIRFSDNEIVNTAVAGTMLMTFALELVTALPSFLGSGAIASLLTVVVGSIGLGASALTQLGRRPYPLAAPMARMIEDDDKVEIVLGTLPEE